MNVISLVAKSHLIGFKSTFAFAVNLYIIVLLIIGHTWPVYYIYGSRVARSLLMTLISIAYTLVSISVEFDPIHSW